MERGRTYCARGRNDFGPGESEQKNLGYRPFDLWAKWIDRVEAEGRPKQWKRLNMCPVKEAEMKK